MTATTTEAIESLPPKLRTIVDGLRALPDDKYRYKQLLFWASKAPSIDAEFAIEANKVPGCLSTVYVHATIDDEQRITYLGDSDAQLTKGLVTLLVRGLSGSTADEIDRVDAAFIKDAGIAASLTPGRNNGFVNMLGVMKAQARSLAASAAVVPEPAADAEEVSAVTSSKEQEDDEKTEQRLGPVGRQMVERLAKLQPTTLELEDESWRHAGHAGAQGFEAGESHFTLRIVAAIFDGMPRVKRHQLVYTFLGTDIMDRIHALQIHARAPGE